MARLNDILQAAQELSGEESTLLLQRLCQAADTELLARLRPGVSPSDCLSVYVLAAAMLAVGARNAVAADGLQSIEAGTLDLHFGSGSQLQELALRMLQPWLRPDTVLRGVAG